MSDSPGSEEKLDDYEVICVIGTGSFGTCYKVRNKRSNEIYVWKAIDYSKMTEDKKQLLVSEVQLLSELRHPNIVHYYNRILHKETTTLYIIMECCQGGDLAAVIASCKRIGRWVEEEFVWRVLYQTGRALQACHSHLGDVTVLHRDIKPANVFLDADNNVKLGDFGLARILKGEEKHSETIVGTPYYMSPEMIKGKKYNRKSDIWALGCLIYELCALTPPFTGANINVLAKNIKAGRFCPIPAHYSQDLYKIIVFMLSVEHEFRPTIEIILHHPTVVSHISLKKTFQDNINKSDREKIENKKKENMHINAVTEAMKKMHLLEREPEVVSENTFKDKWLNRLEMLRNREATLRRKEEDLREKERTLMRKERHLAVIDKVTRERLSRADVYLKQCRQSRSTASLAPRRMSIIEELDSSLSADPGDTSIIATTAKLDPATLHRPDCNLVRYGSERRAKHVHFDKQTTSTRPLSRQTVLGPIQMDGLVGRTIGKPRYDDESENLQNGILDLVPTWSEERKLWLERKRRAYRTQGDKENVTCTNVIATNDAKKIALKSNSIFQFGKSHKSMR